MFYEKYIKLCKKNDVKPYSLAKELGFGGSIVAQWKKGSIPREKNLQKISDYFSVPISFFYEEEKPAGDETSGLSKEMIEIIKLYDKASPELQAAALAMLRAAEAARSVPGEKKEE